MIRRATMAMLLSLCLAACQPTAQENPMNEEKTTRATGAETPMAQVCGAFDVAEVDGLAVPEAAETRAVPGAFLDGFGWCTVTLDGRRALAVEV